MDNKTFLIKSVTLLYLESQLPELIERSNDLIKTGVEKLEKNKVFETTISISGGEILKDLKDALIQIYSSEYTDRLNREDLLQQFRIILSTDEKLYEALEQGLSSDYSDSTIKRLIVAIRRSIQAHYKEQEVMEILNKAQRDFLFNRSSIKNVSEFISTLIDQLEPLQINQTGKDQAIIAEVDIASQESVTSVFNNVRRRATGKSILKTGWEALNIAMQGGIRRGEFVLLPALQHKYKSGFSLTIFSQIARCNVPAPKDITKKPLLVRISFEDSLESNMQFLYQQLKYTETMEPVYLEGKTDEEMAIYVKTKLQVNGYHVKFIRVDPTQWTYKHICNKILELESLGYEIELLMLDYLALVPTIGCRQGPAGTDLRDMFRRIKNFTSSKDIALVTPHQVSTEAKMLLRAGTSDLNFVKEIAEKGYYADCKQLDQEIDLEVYIHVVRYKKDYYLAVQRGKHRITTIIPEESKFFLLKFPFKMPIPDDKDGIDSSFKRIPTENTVDVKTDGFNF